MLQSHYFYFLKHNIQSRLLKKRRALLAGMKITYRCNLRCKACPFWRMENQFLSYEDACVMMDNFYDNGVRLIIFEGGEPFLWQDGNRTLEDLILYAKQKFFCTAITSNGMSAINTSADVVWISIDGLAETHNQNRGNSFDRVIENMRRSEHPKILANITINRLNHLEIPELVEYLAAITKGITIQFYYPFPNSDDLGLTVEQRVAVLDELILLKKRGLPVFHSHATLEDLKHNTWTCHPWLIASGEPDGRESYGCYLKNRAQISCEKCGFAAHTEISKAYDWNIEAIWNGRKIFNFKLIDIK